MAMKVTGSDALPKSIMALVALCVETLDPNRIVLFGSRARGSYRITSDYDLLIEPKVADRSRWLKFLNDIESKNVTLYPVDLVDYYSCEPELRKHALREGTVLYERNEGV